jgi:hypothetical protein
MEEFRRVKTFLRKVDEILSDFTASYPTRQHSCEFLDILSGACLVSPMFHDNLVNPNPRVGTGHLTLHITSLLYLQTPGTFTQ